MAKNKGDFYSGFDFGPEEEAREGERLRFMMKAVSYFIENRQLNVGKALTIVNAVVMALDFIELKKHMQNPSENLSFELEQRLFCQKYELQPEDLERDFLPNTPIELLQEQDPMMVKALMIESFNIQWDVGLIQEGVVKEVTRVMKFPVVGKWLAKLQIKNNDPAKECLRRRAQIESRYNEIARVLDLPIIKSLRLVERE